MKVEDILDLGGGRYKIVLDNGTVFSLYKKELEQLEIAKGKRVGTIRNSKRGAAIPKGAL